MLALAATLALGLAAPPAADTVSFRFAWPDALAAEVEQRRTRARTGKPTAAQAARARMVAELRGGERRIAFRDWRVAGPGPAAPGMDPLLAAAGRITTVTTRAGGFVRVDGIEPAVEVIRALGKDAPAEARPMIGRLAQLAPSLFAKEASEQWNVLVQFWDGKDLDVGEDYEVDSRVPVPVFPGESIRVLARIRVVRRLPCPGGGACVEARMRSEPDAKDVERLARRLFAELKVPEQASATLGEMSAVTDFTLVTEPARLVPHRLEKVRTTRIAPAPGAAADARPAEGRDESVWSFTYPAAGPPAGR